MQKSCDDDQVLMVHPDQYKKYFSIYDALEETSRKLFEEGTMAELDLILEAVCFYLSPVTAKIVLEDSNGK